jgi:hypothetical protein
MGTAKALFQVLILTALLLGGIVLGSILSNMFVHKAKAGNVTVEGISGDQTGEGWVSRYHDKLSGDEFLCFYSGVYGGHAASCVKTSRNWK